MSQRSALISCPFLLQRTAPRSSAGTQAKRVGAGRGKANTGHKGSKSGKSGKKGMKRSASFAFGPADGEPGMRRRSVNVSASSASVCSLHVQGMDMTLTDCATIPIVKAIFTPH